MFSFKETSHTSARGPSSSAKKKKKDFFLQEIFMILRQACSQEYPEAQFAFKDLMIHGILQFTLRIAFRCVLHRCENQEIHC